MQALTFDAENRPLCVEAAEDPDPRLTRSSGLGSVGRSLNAEARMSAALGDKCML